MAEDSELPDRIEPAFRHGSITAVGVFSAFSLGFLTAWASNPIPWGVKDVFPLITIVFGVIFELTALGKLLHPRCLVTKNYMQAIRFFLAGMILVSIGVAAALAVDFLSLSVVQDAIE